MTTYPAYQSPIRTFESLGISTENIDPVKLRMERKRLLLEIQISDTQTTMLGNKELGKNDVIELFDQLENISNLAYHQAIFDHPVLLHFLEHANVTTQSTKQQFIHFDTQEEWDDFTRFVSPYLTFSFDKMMSKVILKSSFWELDKVMHFTKLLTPIDGVHAFRKLNNFCITLSERLKMLASKSKRYPEKDTAFLSYGVFYKCINTVSTFYPNLPNVLAAGIINFMVMCQHKPDRGKNLVDITNQLLTLNCSEHLRQLIAENGKVYRRSKEESTSYNPNTAWRVIIGVIVGILMIFRVASRCDSGSSSSYDLPSNESQQEMFERIREQIRQQRGNQQTQPQPVPQVQPNTQTYRSVPPTRPGTVDFDENSFLDLHHNVIASIGLSRYEKNPISTVGNPKILSAFPPSAIEFNYTLTNETESDAILIMWYGDGLTSHFVKAGNTIDFKAADDACFFIYSGKAWSDSKTITHPHRSPRTQKTQDIQFNGYFSLVSPQDIVLAKKYYSLNGNRTKDLVLKDNYQLFQGGSYVNYSY